MFGRLTDTLWSHTLDALEVFLARKPPQSDPLYKHVGRRVRELRDSLKPRMTQQQLADLVSLSRESIANIETGRQQLLLHHAQQIAEVLGARLEDLMPARTGFDVAPSMEEELAGRPEDEQQFVLGAINPQTPRGNNR